MYAHGRVAAADAHRHAPVREVVQRRVRSSRASSGRESPGFVTKWPSLIFDVSRAATASIGIDSCQRTCESYVQAYPKPCCSASCISSSQRVYGGSGRTVTPKLRPCGGSPSSAENQARSQCATSSSPTLRRQRRLRSFGVYSKLGTDFFFPIPPPFVSFLVDTIALADRRSASCESRCRPCSSAAAAPPGGSGSAASSARSTSPGSICRRAQARRCDASGGDRFRASRSRRFSLVAVRLGRLQGVASRQPRPRLVGERSGRNFAGCRRSSPSFGVVRKGPTGGMAQ